MTSISAAIFDVVMQRREQPPLDSKLHSYALETIPEQWYHRLQQTAFDAFFLTMPFVEARTQGMVGVPILSEEEVAALLSNAEFRGDDSVPGANHPVTWWEMWRTADGNYALLPGDNDAELTIATCALLRTGSRVQMRRFSTGFALTRQGFRRRTPMNITPAVCTQEDDDLPGMPYHGHCANHGCGAGCSADVVAIPRDGIYRLQGCTCS